MNTALHTSKTPSSARRLAIIGTGVLGTSLGIALARRGYVIAGVADRRTGAARQASDLLGGVPHSTDAAQMARQADLILITTSDDAIADVCKTITAGGGIGNGDIVLHCSGALGSDSLVSARAHGASVASMHPIGVFADVETAVAHFSGIFYSLEGESGAVAEAEKMIADLGGFPLRVTPQQKMRLHIAACMVANYTATLMDMAASVMVHLSLSRNEVVRILLPLLAGVVRSLEESGLPRALTGPISRGDIATLRGHLETIGQNAELVHLYASLGMRTLPLALEKGLLEESQSEMVKELFLKTLGSTTGTNRPREKGDTRT